MIAEEFEIDQLIGKKAKIYPYCRGFYPRDFMYLLWKMVESEDASSLLFHVEPKSENMPYETRGDLVAFCEFFKEKYVLITFSIEANEVMGFLWLDEIIEGKRASASVFCRRRFWGEEAREASALVMNYGFKRLNLQTIWASTPWKTAVQHSSL